jgi:hypothetical protein
MLGLTALDGELFGPLGCPDLETAACRNEDLLRALFHLSTFEDMPEGRGRAKKRGVRRRVNYAGLDVEELGSVYEGLLEYHPHVDRERWTFDLVAGSERKQTGSYYTPHALVMELIDSALVPVMEERLAKATTPEAKERALLDLKVVDPAAGSGHFLLAAARRIGKELARVRTSEPEPAPEAQRAAIRDLVRHCLYAVDRNPLAVDLCKVALWIEGHNTGRPLSFLDHHVKLGDSLIGVFDLKVLEQGIPDDAYKPLTGDDKDLARDLKRRNRLEREGQETLGLFGTEDLAAAEAGIARAARELEDLEDDSPAAVHEKGRRYQQFRELHPDFRRLREACDLWTAAFFTKLEKSAPGAPERIPTTDHVLRALRNQPGIQGVMKTALELAQDHRFFHWPLEFAEVFANGGFDVALGNPPWERIKLQEKEFFAARDREIATAQNKAEREQLIKTLPQRKPRLAQQWNDAQHAAEAASLFVRASGRFPLTAVGDVNTYAIFAEAFSKLVGRAGRSGFIVQSGIATDNSTKAFFDEMAAGQRFVTFFDMVNLEGIFPGIHRTHPHFCLLTLSGGQVKGNAAFSFYNTNTKHLSDERRRFTLSPDDVALINPNTKTCPIFRSQADAELTKKIYRRVPVLVEEARGGGGDPWGISFMTMFHMANDSGLFRTHAQLRDARGALDGMEWTLPNGERWLPLYEAKMVHQFDDRWATYEADGESPRDAGNAEKQDALFRPMPRYWLAEHEVEVRLKSRSGPRGWLLGWRDVTNATNERTVIAAAIPRVGVGHTMPLMFVEPTDVRLWCGLEANLNSLVYDFVARQKIGGTHLTYSYLKQFPTLPPSAYSDRDLDFIVPKVLELTYTAWDVQPFARDLGYEGEPFRWDPERRAELRAELDAYYAYLYGLSKKELRYILDPTDVMGEDYPSETFRVLKNNEIRKYGEYRTQRLVLEAYDRFVNDGTFDPARLVDEEYFPVVIDALRGAQDQLKRLVARSDQTPLPTLFVEGETDKLIVEAAWRALFPGEPIPVSVLPAGGTTQMKSLATPGKAMRDLLGGRVVLALADNDAEGRELWNEGNLHKGGVWKPQTNGVHWCLLRPSEEFTAIMERFQIPRACWPSTIENAFPAALRREAMAAGAYAISDKVQSDLIRDPEVAQRIFTALRGLVDTDNAHFYLLAPTPEAKDSFAAWVTDPARLRPENFTAFQIVLSRLKDLLAQSRTNREPPQQQRRLA